MTSSTPVTNGKGSGNDILWRLSNEQEQDNSYTAALAE